MKCVRWFLPAVLFIAIGANAQVWTENGNADSFPDGIPERTRGSGELTTIEGFVAPEFTDTRDAYCIRITDPAGFLATTDSAIDGRAGTSFDSSLFLFRPDGAPILANEDTEGTSGPGSTLTPVATDSFPGFVLSQPGEYILVVAHAPLIPKDAEQHSLFYSGPPDLVRSASSLAGVFDAWNGLAPGTGVFYTVVLRGVAYCQSDLDAVFANIGGNPEKNRVCHGDNEGTFDCSDVHTGGGVAPYYPAAGVATGFLDQDPYLDAVFANPGSNDLRCHGREDGSFECVDVASLETNSSYDVALGFLNHDQYLDAVFANGGNELNRLCLGLDGSGPLVCRDIGTIPYSSHGVALGFLDSDRHLDGAFANYGAADRICHGYIDGSGQLGCGSYSPEPDSHSSLDVALGDVNGDQTLDVVFARNGFKNRLYLNNGDRTYVQLDVSTDQNHSRGVALGYVDGDDALDAVFANYNERNRVCLGNGDGTFNCLDVSSDENYSESVALGMVDGDGYLDAVFANNYGEKNRLCLGAGDGTFVCRDLSSDAHQSFAVALGEFDLRLPSFFADGFESGDTTEWSATVP